MAKEVRWALADGQARCRSEIVGMLGETGNNPVIGPMLHKMHAAGHLSRRLRKHPDKQMRVWYYKLKTV